MGKIMTLKVVFALKNEENYKLSWWSILLSDIYILSNGPFFPMYKQAKSNKKKIRNKTKSYSEVYSISHFMTFGIEGNKGRPFFLSEIANML